MKNQRFALLKFLATAALTIGGITLWPFSKAIAAPQLTITPITWNILGLDSNNPNTGPNVFMVGARVCNVGDTAATNVRATFVRDGATNSYINLQGASTLSITSVPAGSTSANQTRPPQSYGSIPSNCTDFYYNIVITRTTSAYHTKQQYHIEAVADNAATVMTPTNRELYVEKLVSQNRNSVYNITGPSTVVVGQTYQYIVRGKTATGGYEQLVFSPNFPNIIFQVLGVSASYTSPSGATNNSVYADACGWTNDITSSYYHNNSECTDSSIPDGYSDGKAGNDITTVYTVKILSAGSASISNLIYDFSGSSYHYNSDFGTGINAISVTAQNPSSSADLEISKTHSGNFSLNVDGQYNLTVRNVGSSSTTGTITVTDTLNTSLNYVSATGTGWNCTFDSVSRKVTCTTNAILAAGASSNPITLTVTPTTASSFTNSAAVTTAGDLNSGNNTANDPTTVNTPVNLSITKTDGLTTISPGGLITYTLKVKNNSDNAVANASVADSVPAIITGTSGTGSVSWTCSITDGGSGSGSNSCGAASGTGNEIDTTVTLKRGAEATYTITGKLSSTAGVTSLANTALVTPPVGSADTNPADNTATDIDTVLIPDLTISKTHTGNFTQGQTGATYTLSVTNSGTTSTSGTVTVTDTIPTGLTATAASGSGWTCNITGSGTGVSCSRNDALAAGASYPPITVTVNVAANAASSVTNRADVSGGGENNTTNDSASDPTTINAVPILTVTKVTSTPSVTAGGTASYTITVSNAAGSGTATNFNVSDALPTGFTYASTGTVTLSGGATRTSTTNPTAGATNPSWGTFTIPAGGSLTIPFTVNVGLGVSAGTYQNPASATYTNPSGTSGSANYNSASSTGEDVTVASVVGQPFACDGRFYQIRVVGSGASAHSELYRIDRIPNPYQHTLLLNPTPAVKLNALGLNPVDGYMYAIEFGTNKLYRLTQSNASLIGNVSTLPAGSYSAGTFDRSGNYYVVPDNDNSKIYRVDISSKTATAISLSASITAGDIAFNPVNGKMYGLLSGNLYQIDVNAGSTANVSAVGFTGIPAESPVGSVFFDASGTFYADNTFGDFYQIDLTNATSTEVSNTQSASRSDGTSCPFTPQILDVVKSAGTATTVNSTTFDVPYTVAIKNTGTVAAPNVQITENLNLTFNTGNPAIAIQSPPTLSTGTGNLTLNSSFNGTSNFKLLAGTDTLASGAVRAITFTVRLTYPDPASVPSNIVQNNTAYASSISSNANPGYTFFGGNSDVPIPPPDLLTSDLSTDSTDPPNTPHGDTPTPTPITLPFTNNPNVLLVKRITMINNDITTLDGDNLSGYIDDSNNPYDDNDITLNNPVPPNQPDTDKWPDPDNNGKPDDLLIGGIDGGKVKPGDEVEYTIYYLSAGNNTAQNVLLCDRVPENTRFIPTAFDSFPSLASGGLPGADRGILWLHNGAIESLTNVNDGDAAQYFPSGVEPTTVYPNINCGGANTNGAVVFNLGNLPKATAAGTPASSYGFIRFQGLVK